MKKKLSPVFIFLSLIIAIYSIPFLPLKQINIEGNNYISTETLNSNFTQYKNKHIIKLLMFNRLKKDIKNMFPEIKDITVSYQFPNRLKLSIREKDPWVVCLSEGQSWLIANDGTIISTDEAIINNNDELLFIKGLDPQYFTNKKMNAGVLDEIKKYHELLALYFSDTKLMIESDTFNHIILILDDHIQVYLGEFIDSNKKLKDLKKFLSYIPKEKKDTISYIDLRVDKKVFVKYGS